MGAKVTMTHGPEAGTERLHALDAVRAGALLLGVVFHATMSYVPGTQIWAVRDEQSPVLGVVFFVSHIFRMALFFLIAGFFGRMACQRRGPRGFLRDRLKRIALPLVAFWPVSIVSISAVFIWGFVAQHGTEAVEAMAPPPQAGGSFVETFPLTHLWFLYVLLGSYAAALALRGIVASIDRDLRLRAGVDRLVSALVTSGLAPLALALPAGVALYLRKDWLLWLGVPTPDRGLIPNAPALATYGVAFAFGWVLQRQTSLLGVFERRWLPHLAAAIGLSVASIWIAGVTAILDPAAQRAAQDPLMRLALAACYPLATWVWSFGLIGLALRFLSERKAVIRYLADASYWIYLIHLPIVAALQVAVFPLRLPALVKFAMVLAVAFAILPVTYHLLVRHTFVGAVLNGRRHQRRGRAAGSGGRLATAAQ